MNVSDVFDVGQEVYLSLSVDCGIPTREIKWVVEGIDQRTLHLSRENQSCTYEFEPRLDLNEVVFDKWFIHFFDVGRLVIVMDVLNKYDVVEERQIYVRNVSAVDLS